MFYLLVNLHILYYYLYQFPFTTVLWKFLYQTLYHTNENMYTNCEWGLAQFLGIGEYSVLLVLIAYICFNPKITFYQPHQLLQRVTWKTISVVSLFLIFLLKYSWFTVWISPIEHSGPVIHIYVYIYTFFLACYLPPRSIPRHWI